MKHPVVFENVEDTSAEAVVVEWVVSVGGPVQAGETVVEVDMDKVVIEIPAPVSEVLVEISYETDDEISASYVLGYIEDGT